ncbi:MAG: J domain-containing protein [Deltaproteobacteria bacterium]|nr:J domain-containing protein [Deltaproteobacteria bacterium]
MARRDFYAILGVPARAEPAEIKRAYRRLAFAHHPDVGPNPDAERFHEVHEAYEVLSNPEQRRAYDVSSVSRHRSLAAEPLRARGPMRVFEDHLTVRPSIEGLLDHISQNFFGYRIKSGGPFRKLGMEVILEPEEARFGCRLPLHVPSYTGCPQCTGMAETWNLCPACQGRGMIETVAQAIIEIPPGTTDGDRYEIDLRNAGIGNLLLDVRIVVT